MSFAVKSEGRARQGELGQFLTTSPVADFMASVFGPLPTTVRLLDAGAGAGALTTAFVARLCENKERVRSIEATLYELDPLIAKTLSDKMEACQDSCANAGIRFRSNLYLTDFVQEMSSRLAGGLFGEPPPAFDAAIVNPPYRKIGADSPERRALRSIGVETSNLYTGFIAIIQRLLAPGGQLIAITPRSFCNGPYFRSFREDFLRNLELHRLHVFESRTAAFRADGVLQENVVFHAVKGTNQPRDIVVSSSSGTAGDPLSESIVPFAEVVHPDDGERFIHIPSAPGHAAAKETMRELRSSLADLGLSVSTGRVVGFRVKDALRQLPGEGTVPLIHPCHFNGGKVHWPGLEGRKANAILDNEETRPWLVPSGLYLLTKRFTSKEERRRLVACMLDPDALNARWIGFENHLNYFHAAGRGLGPDLAFGLFIFLNSTVVDQYFRGFSGHTQVNATDLRKLPYPDRDVLRAMGAELTDPDPSQGMIDDLLSKHINGRG